MVSRYSIRETVKGLAQDPGTAGVQLLLTYPDDYNRAILQALHLFDSDRPNERVVDEVLAAAAFRYVLAGTGALTGLTGLDAWADGKSNLVDVYYPWLVTSQGQSPIDRNAWRLVRDPGPKVVLELLDTTGAVGYTLRLVFTSPHVLTEAPNTVAAPTAVPTTVLAGVGAGNVDNGAHSYVYTWTTIHGETLPSPAAAPVTVVDKTSDGKITVTIPPSTDSGITGAKVYRTVAGDAGTRKLVGTMTSATGGGSFTDNVADAGLGATVPAANTAGGGNTVLEAHAEPFALLGASVVLELAAVKAAQNTGNTGLPNDVVDRRSQSDIFKSRSKELRDLYRTIIGAPTDNAGPLAASAWKDLDISMSHTVGPLWHLAGRR